MKYLTGENKIMKYLHHSKGKDKLINLHWSEVIEFESENFVIVTLHYAEKWSNKASIHTCSNGDESGRYNAISFFDERLFDYLGEIRIESGWTVLSFAQHKYCIVLTLVKEIYKGSF